MRFHDTQLTCWVIRTMFFVIFYTYVPMIANFEIDNGTKTAESTKYHSLIEFAQALKMLVSED